RYEAYPHSSGLSDSRNRGLGLADTRYILFVDADAIPERGWASALRNAFASDERTALVAARILPLWPSGRPMLFDTAPAEDFLGMLDLGGEEREVPRVMGTSFALDRERLPSPAPFATELGRRPGSLAGGE